MKKAFSGLLRCADCGSGFVHRTTKQTRKDGRVVNYTTYSCSLYLSTGCSACSSHSISELALLEIIRQDIRRHLEQADFIEGHVISEIQSRLSQTSIDAMKRELTSLSIRLAELDKLGIKLYEDRLNGAISLDTYLALSNTAEEERTVKQSKHDEFVKAVAAAERQSADIQDWLGNIRSFMALDAPTNDTLAALIKRIEVGENEGTPQNRKQSVKITYRFVGDIN